MGDIEEFLDEREVYIYRNHPAKSFKKLGEEFGVSATRISQIKEKAIQKIRYEKRRAIARPWYDEEVTVSVQRRELHLLKRAVSAYQYSVCNSRWEHQKGLESDPEYELCIQLSEKINKAIAFETHPCKLNTEGYLFPNIDDVK